MNSIKNLIFDTIMLIIDIQRLINSMKIFYKNFLIFLDNSY